ncbi:MAG: hypothetical protein BJ554DRAFT_3627, partial [Olpidium bornovanus]
FFFFFFFLSPQSVRAQPAFSFAEGARPSLLPAMDSMSELLSTPQRRFYAAAGLPVLLLLLLGLTGPVLAVLMAFAAGYFVAFPGANAFADKSAAYEEELACLRRRRSAGGPPGGPPDCQAAGDAYALRTPAPPQTAVPAPVKLSASGALDPHVTALVDHVVRDYVMSWYGALCAPPPSEDGAAAAAASDAVAPAQEFPNAVKGALYQVVGSLAAHLGKSDPARLAVLTGYCVSHLLIVHMVSSKPAPAVRLKINCGTLSLLFFLALFEAPKKKGAPLSDERTPLPPPPPPALCLPARRGSTGDTKRRTCR